MTLALAENPRTANKAAIRRAALGAQRDLRKLDKSGFKQITAAYRQAIADMTNTLDQHAGSDGTLRLEVMQDMLAQAQARLAQLERQKQTILDTGRAEAAALGAGTWSAEAATLGASLSQIADDALLFAQNFVASDGLQLADRVWRNSQHTRQVVADAIQQAIIQGHSASRAAQDFIARGLPLPPDIARKMAAANGRLIADKFRNELMNEVGNPYDNALRLFRTEINRAHGEAFRAGAFEHPDVIGTRFLLSPNHPKPDICDLHASVNRYGLGKGVYPKGKSPWPAHPNTLSFEEVVFADEVNAEDRAGKQTRLEWLAGQSPADQASVLNSRMKAEALRRGILNERQINTPWKVLKVRLDRRGIDYAPWLQTAQGGGRPTLRPIRAPAGFEHAKTVKEAEKWAIDQGLANRVDYEKIDVRVANEWNKSIYEHVTEFPQLRDNLKFIGTIQARNRAWYDQALKDYVEKTRAMNPDSSIEDIRWVAKLRIKRPRTDGRVWAQSSPSKTLGGVTINNNWGNTFDDLKAALKHNVDSRFHPVGADTVKSIIDHELGHQLDDLLSINRDQAVIRMYNKWRSSDPKGEALSVYARKNIKEFIAESWAEYRNNDQPRPVAAELGRLIQRKYLETYDG